MSWADLTFSLEAALFPPVTTSARATTLLSEVSPMKCQTEAVIRKHKGWGIASPHIARSCAQCHQCHRQHWLSSKGWLKASFSGTSTYHWFTSSTLGAFASQVCSILEDQESNHLMSAIDSFCTLPFLPPSSLLQDPPPSSNPIYSGFILPIHQVYHGII